MSFTYENQAANTFLVYQLQNDEKIDTLSLGMLSNNKIKGIAPTVFMQMDDNRFLKYNITAKVSLKQFLEGSVTKKRLLGTFSSICSAVISSDEYMIDPSNLVIEQDYIFADVTTCEADVICLPIIQEQKSFPDMGAFFKTIVFSTQFDQTENCDYVAKLINYLNSAPMFSLADFKTLVDSLNSSAPASVKAVSGSARQAPPILPVAVIPEQKTMIRPAPEHPIYPMSPQKAPAVPNVRVPAVNHPVAQSSAPVKKMSMLHLLMHYNKENVAAYKMQKNSGNIAPKSSKTQQKNKPKQQIQQPAFAIPGMQVSPNPAAPQQASVRPEVIAGNQSAVKSSHRVVQQPCMETVSNPVACQPQPAIGTVAANFGETTVLCSAAGETTVLGAGQGNFDSRPYLTREKNHAKIYLDKPVFRIGKEKSYVDYFIGDNSAISRSHANVISRNGEYFIVDTNSTNHTYVNGNMIQSNVETKIAHGAKIILANEEFTFNIY